MVEVHKLTPEHLDAFRELRLRGLDEAPLAFATTAEAWRAADEQTVRAMLEASEEGTATVILGAFDAGALVGLGGLKRDTRAGVRHKASLWGLYVAPSSRGHGVGRALVDALLADARSREGLEMVRLVAPQTAAAALRLFERAGFERYGTEPRARLFEGTYVDQHFFYRFL